MRLLVVEDTQKDLSLAVNIARSMGFSDIEARTTAESSRAWLEARMKGEVPLPQGIILDLDLGFDSGYELLRFCHSTPALSKLHIYLDPSWVRESRSMRSF